MPGPAQAVGFLAISLLGLVMFVVFVPISAGLHRRVSQEELAMSDEVSQMDSILYVTGLLREQGFVTDFSATGDGQLRCDRCGSVHDPSQVEVEQVHRFEGASDPSDESVLFALAAPACHRGTYASAYGPDTPPADVAVVRALRLKPGRLR